MALNENQVLALETHAGYIFEAAEAVDDPGLGGGTLGGPSKLDIAKNKNLKVQERIVEWQLKVNRNNGLGDPNPEYASRVAAAYLKVRNAAAIADQKILDLEAAQAGIAPEESVLANENNSALEALANNPPSDNNPADELLPLEEEAAIEEEVIFDADDQGEVIDVPPPPSEIDSVDLTTEADVVNDSNTNEELASEPVTLRTPVIETRAKSIDEDVYVEYPNVLHDYPSYTYGISLHLLTGDDWNDLATTGNYQPKNVLIASAGKFDTTVGPNKLVRNKHFNEDFYFDDLDMTTVIGPTENNPNANAIDFRFTIIEPYGVTLINRIIDATKDLSSSEKATNYLENPYLLQIDFYAQSADGTVLNPIPGITKYLPIKLTKLGFTVDTQGAKYSIGAVPFNHSAFDLATQTTPIAMEIVSGTVADFFSNNGIETISTDFANAQAREKAAKDEYEATLNNSLGNRTLDVVPELLLNNLHRNRRQVFKVKGYASAWNAYHEGLKKNKDIIYNDTIQFKFDDEIGKAVIAQKGKLGIMKIPMAADGKSQSDQKKAYVPLAGNTQYAVNLDETIRRYPINAGTSIESLLDDVITNSTYVLDQIWDPTDYSKPEDFVKARQSKKDVPFNWFKVIPEVRLEKFDKQTGRWSRTITYNVVKYVVKNSKLDTMPGGQAQVPLKVYKYIYTGENNDILDFNIEFNALYYTAVTSYPGKLTRTEGTTDTSQEKVEKNTKVEESQSSPYYTVQPKRIIPQILDSQRLAGGDGTSSKQMVAADATKSILTSAQGDMINVFLKIIGDPLFIKQDDIFYSKTAEKSKFKNVKITPNGSFITDNGEIYVQVEWKTPVDVDQQTGLSRFEEKYQNSLFNGMYKVITVDSSFSGGQFVQTLNLVRLFGQERFDYTVPAKSNSQEERADTEEQKNNGEYVSKNQEPAVSTDTADLGDVSTPTVANEVAENSQPEQSAVDLGEDVNDLASRQEFKDLATAFENAENPFEGIPAGGTVLDQQNSVNNLFGQ